MNPPHSGALALPCPHCGAFLPANTWLSGIDVCWPYRRFVRTACASCGKRAMLLPGWETLTIGTVDATKDPVLRAGGTLEPDDYDVNWSSAGVRVNLGGERFTARASEVDLVEP